MSDSNLIKTSIELRNIFLKALFDEYTLKLRKYLKENPQYIDTCAGFLVNPSKIIVYITKTHIAFEYDGNLKIKAGDLEDLISIDTVVWDYGDEDVNFLEKIIGFDYSKETGHAFPLPVTIENFIIPTNAGWSELLLLKWNFLAQESNMVFNAKPVILKDQFHRIINTFFFDTNKSGLVTRHIKWLDIFPITYEDSDNETCHMSFNKAWFKIYEFDAKYIYPQPHGYKESLLPRINRFIEICGNRLTTEKEITQFIARDENRFLLSMRFGAEQVYPEVACEYQSEKRQGLRPDFFLLHSNGYADIVEFKLPYINSPIVGANNRETFSAEINSCISQLRVYSQYFDDPNNRVWFEKKHGFKVYKPKRILVIGRRADFESGEWRKILSDNPDVDLYTYDDLIDGVTAQFYYRTD